jgi:hypothetical protein
MDEEKRQRIRFELDYGYLCIAEDHSLMFENIDSFVALSRENDSVKEVGLHPFHSNAGNYEFWDKTGQIVGNLIKLDTIVINICLYADDDNNGDEARMPDWETLARILPYLQHKIELFWSIFNRDVEVEDIEGLARVIHGHPMISGFTFPAECTFANMGPWCSTLITLPSLEHVTFGLRQPATEDQRVLLNLEPFQELLRKPTVRVVEFVRFHFTNELCYSIVNALEEGSSITDITFDSDCSFPDGGRALIAKALKTNASVTDVEFRGDCDEPFCDTLAAVLLCNSTLQNLALRLPEGIASGRWLCPIFLSLGMNTTLESLSVGICDHFGDELCAFIESGLAKNSTLKKLSLLSMRSSDEDGAVSSRNTLSFLRTNSTLRSLTVSFVRAQKESYVSAFRLEAMEMLDNTFLESLTIIDCSGSAIKIEELFALLSALKLNTTLKALRFPSHCFVLYR